MSTGAMALAMRQRLASPRDRLMFAITISLLLHLLKRPSGPS